MSHPFRARIQSLEAQCAREAALSAPGPKRFAVWTVLLANTALCTTAAHAQVAGPQGGQVAVGQASISQSGVSTIITQSTQRAVVNWDNFSVDTGGSVVFDQPNRDAAILNRVTGATASSIAGSLTGNGQVYLVNPNGIAVTPTGSVDVGGGFVASTLGISDSDFMSGNLAFAASQPGNVTNAGRISVATGGFAALLGGSVTNSGTISVPLGRIGLGSSAKATLDLAGDGFLQVAVPSGASSAQPLVDAGGTLTGAHVELRAASVVGAIRDAVNVPGTLTVRSAYQDGGAVVLDGGDGAVTISGKIDASSATGIGGRVTAEARAISLVGGAHISATGATSGGTVLIGGNIKGAAGLRQATTVSMGSDALIDVSATIDGKGGTAVLWSDVSDTTSFTTAAGTIKARGAATGDGGFVETSGHQINTTGALVNAGSDQGTGGLWLIDPLDTTIDQATADSYRDALNAGTSVLTDVTGSITWNNNVSLNKTSGGAATLTLRAAGAGGTGATSIALNNATITSNSNSLNLVLWTRYNGNTANGPISITGSTITTNGGHVWLGGGGTDGGVVWNGINVGGDAATAWTPDTKAISIVNSQITTGAGSIEMLGYNSVTSTADSSTQFGIWIDGGTTLSTTSGHIGIFGTTDGKFKTGGGVWIGDSDNPGSVKISSTTGAIDIVGTGRDQLGSDTGWRHGLIVYREDVSGSTTISSTSGNINLHGDALYSTNNYTSGDSSGVQLHVVSSGGYVGVTSQSGAISIQGSNTLEANSANINGLRISAPDTTNSISIGYDGTNSYSGAITITSDSIQQRYARSGAGSISIQSTGGLTIQSLSNAFTYLRQGAAPLTFDNDWNFGTSLASLTVGKTTNTLPLTFSNAITTSGSISIYGGNTALNGGMITTLTGAGVLVKSTGSIKVARNLNFRTNNGPITLWSGSSTASTDGSVTINEGTTFNTANGSISQLDGGGAFTIGGGVSGTLTPLGAASSGTWDGILFSGEDNVPVSVYTGGGNISLAGTATGAWAVGLRFRRLVNLDAGNGAISLWGSSVPYFGIEFGAWGDVSAPYKIVGGSISISGTSRYHVGIASIHQGGMIKATGPDGLTISGSTESTNTSHYGLNFEGAADSLQSENGQITINGSAPRAVTSVNLKNQILSLSGPITINAGTKGLNLASVVGSDGTVRPSSSSNVTLTADSLTFSNAAINTTGTLTVQPYSASFSRPLVWGFDGLTLRDTLSALTLGKVGNTANISVITAANVAGPIDIYGGDLAINAGLAAGGGAILLQALGAGGISGVGNISNFGSLTLNAANSAATGAVALSGVISGNGVVSKIGAGKVTLTGTNTYSGGTNVSAGTLAAHVDTAKNGIGTGAANIASGATLILDNRASTGGAIVSVGNHFSGTGAINLNFENTYNGDMVTSGIGPFAGNVLLTASNVTKDKWAVGGMGVMNSSVTVTSGTTLFAGSGGVSFAGGISVSGNGNAENYGAIRVDGGGVLGGNITITGGEAAFGSASGGGTISGAISSSTTSLLTIGHASVVNQPLTLTGNITGSNLRLETYSDTIVSGLNSYSSTTTVKAGRFKAGYAGGFSANSSFDVAAGATLDLNGYSSTIASLSGAGQVTNSGTTDATLATNGNHSNTVFSGVISDGNSKTSIAKAGAGSLTLSGANTYTGSTTVNFGKVTIGEGGSLGAGSYAGNIAVGSSGTFEYASSIDQILSGTIAGAGAVSKSGPNSLLTLAGANSFTGLLSIKSSTLNLTGSWNLGGGQANVEIGSSGALAGTGAISAAKMVVDGQGGLLI